jgi:hypothetical protein
MASMTILATPGAGCHGANGAGWPLSTAAGDSASTSVLPRWPTESTPRPRRGSSLPYFAGCRRLIPRSSARCCEREPDGPAERMAVEIERITLVKPVRMGFTTLLTGTVGHFVANDPAPILALLPTESDARD